MTDTSYSKNKTPFISIITVSYNAVEYIEQCLQSVVEQTFDNFEYIVIDGGSSDGTDQLIEKYQDDLSYWHSKPDRGLAHAFNLAVSHARGQWILFLNSDDYFVNSYVLENMYQFLTDNEYADVIFGQVEVVSREDSPKKIGGPYGAPFKWRQFLMRDTIPHQAAFTNKKLFINNGVFDEDFHIAVDYEHYLRTGSKLSAIFYPILVANMRDGGLSQKSKFQTLYDIHKARVKNKVVSYPTAWAILFYFVSRAFIGSYVRKIFDFKNKIRK